MTCPDCARNVTGPCERCRQREEGSGPPIYRVTHGECDCCHQQLIRTLAAHPKHRLWLCEECLGEIVVGAGAEPDVLDRLGSLYYPEARP